ncbi:MULTISPECIES: NAD(P)-dependent alcohol dehydrogenase [Chryseobacterium]|uniref:NAD(P)-dependent alcohol dehydrogenase n=1 Tax=Chryseobacterium TaxID=59732 RepID=UPI00195B6441|nr:MULTISPECIES: NAD(P)-dependent alcohol dehydrogenase [Chryseobacterium]MBM7421322.1 putative zinc-type alcohol dehydrogenase-like protein [Chryseobacterium sp. JUb44]MDH6211283.1 putative zinc-type alcohol dehydrogenase-like protein [Chryseobacterium sp. BIGb0186]WSO09942.1 NAD(P)-dependent alcohol dehydrogenase [Chryseobacterium scophthalmum]
MIKKKIIQVATLCILLISVKGFAQNTVPAKGLAAHDGHFHNHVFTRHAVGDNDVQIEILYAGICHSDFGTLGATKDKPIVPGHEIVGRIIKIGKKVTKFKIGDYAGVGCMVNSCGECDNCKMGKEQYCEKGTVFTYGSKDHYHGDQTSMGGYSDNIVVSDRFAMKVAKNADIKKVAPLLCAGATTWSPIKFSKVKKGDKVGVAGFGGLGHMAVKYLVDLGADVTIFDITEDKRADAKRMGAEQYVNVNNPEELKGLKYKYDFIISTIPADYDPLMYMNMLKMETGEFAIVGLPHNTTINLFPLVIQGAHRKIYGSLIAGLEETQQMLDYSIAHNLYPEVETIKAEPAIIDEAYKNIDIGKVKFRYVIDMKTLK